MQNVEHGQENLCPGQRKGQGKSGKFCSDFWLEHLCHRKWFLAIMAEQKYFMVLEKLKVDTFVWYTGRTE